VLERTDAIGWHPAVYFHEPGHELHGRCLWCIVAVMSDPVTGNPTGAISRTYIGRDGRKIGKAKTLGKPKGVIRISRDEDVLGGLHIAEGLETALSGMANVRRPMRPMWAMGDTGAMKKFPVLPGIEVLTILVDHDENGEGQRAAQTCACRWLEAGREVTRLTPEQPGDFNDLVRQEGPPR
jgi:hypothetical protein